MKRLSLLFLVALVACVPAFQPSQAPESATLTLEPAEGFTWVRMEVVAPVERGYLLVSGQDLAVNAAECTLDADADLRCDTGPFTASYAVAVAGTIHDATAILCDPQTCYYLEPP